MTSRQEWAAASSSGVGAVHHDGLAVARCVVVGAAVVGRGLADGEDAIDGRGGGSRGVVVEGDAAAEGGGGEVVVVRGRRILALGL
eukprot:CAMPEP_0197420182 /NCGR_PEP_ID=MMETSP1170-20131217/5652_1 /TAXON_ID=54406 /ORGANISM="Sarcinochrysis sp, Strain CCMP770" /LENGTH=85 /DNA_ID=CAMNT_0042947327 /DNA_START=133 /DNA_END=387 /DNA_ORIENTATION=+